MLINIKIYSRSAVICKRSLSRRALQNNNYIDFVYEAAMQNGAAHTIMSDGGRLAMRPCWSQVPPIVSKICWQHWVINQLLSAALLHTFFGDVGEFLSEYRWENFRTKTMSSIPSAHSFIHEGAQLTIWTLWLLSIMCTRNVKQIFENPTEDVSF